MQEWRIEKPQTLDLTGVRRLHVRVVGGNVDVVGHQRSADGEARLEVFALEAPLLVSLDGDTLTIAHERLTWGGLLNWVGGGNASAELALSVSEDCPVEIGVVSADAVVSAITADTTIKSVSGDFTLDGVRADISAQTVSGDLETRGLEGALHFTTVSGDLTIVNGSSAQVRAETVSGDLTLDLDVPSGATIDLKSVSGDLTLRLPDSSALGVEVKTMSGELDSAFDEVQVERKPGLATLRGSVGAGTGELRAKTVSGDVTLLRRASA